MVRRSRSEDRPTPTAQRSNGSSHARPTEQAHASWGELKKASGALGAHVPDLRDDVTCYAAVQADRVRLAVSQILVRAAAGILLVVSFAAVFATAASLLIVGAAGGVAAALGGNVWLANVITGVGTLALLIGSIAISVRAYRLKRLRQLASRYDRHEKRQRAQFPATVAGQATTLRESEYLKMQSTHAKARFRRTARELTDDLLRPLDVRPFIRRRPWWSLTGAALIGWVSGFGIGGRDSEGKARDAEGRGRRMLAMATRRVRRIASSTLATMVVANLRRGASSDSDTSVAPSSNGDDPAPS